MMMPFRKVRHFEFRKAHICYLVIAVFSIFVGYAITTLNNSSVATFMGNQQKNTYQNDLEKLKELGVDEIDNPALLNEIRKELMK